MKPVKEQTILVTGSTDGIGKLTALSLAKQHAEVLVHGRNEEKVHQVVTELKLGTGNMKVAGFVADFSSLDEVRSLADQVQQKFPELDVLINNAGVGFDSNGLSKDGYELGFAVNYLASFLLTHLLLPNLKESSPSRIVNVSSAGQQAIDFESVTQENSDGVQAYCRSKLALIMFTMDLAEQLEDEQITVNNLHPGTYLNTNMVRRAGIDPWGEPESGADAEVFLATSPAINGTTGKYFNVTSEARADDQAYDAQARKKLWDLSMKLTGLG